MSSSRLDPGTRRMLGRFAPMIYGPTLLFGLGEGALLPLLPSISQSVGASLSQAALIASAIVVARVFGNLPAGWAVAVIGERWTMAVAGAIALAGVLGLIFATNLWELAISVLGIGLCAAAFGLARHAFMTTRVPLPYRARSLSVLGGSFRLGMFTGPFVGAALVSSTGQERAAAWFFVGCLTALVLLVVVARDPEREIAAEGALPARAAPALPGDRLSAGSGAATSRGRATPERRGVFHAMWHFRGMLLRLGLSAATLSGIRQARVYLLPLWGVSLALDPEAISLIVGLTGALEFLLFYSSGQIMDRWGRLWACLPSMLLMSGAFLGLAFTHDLPTAVGWYIAAAVVVGVGNGLSSGILMTLGSDVAPAADPAPSLGSWRMVTDAGAAAIPLIIAGVTALASVPIATGLIGMIGLAGAGGFAVYVPRYVQRRR